MIIMHGNNRYVILNFLGKSHLDKHPSYKYPSSYYGDFSTRISYLEGDVFVYRYKALDLGDIFEERYYSCRPALISNDPGNNLRRIWEDYDV